MTSVDDRPCLNQDVLLALVEGRLSTQERGEVDHHVDACSTCFQLISELLQLQTPAGEAAPTADLGFDEPLAIGTRLGRYIIQRCLGMGGMGIVHAAYDPELDRRLALKLVRVDRVGAARARELLSREARAMARLSHPNVVAVHDVGAEGERLFVAMELVDGLTLDRWCTTHQPSLHELLKLFEQAAQGLAAAHEAGIVHHDFKPSNVLVEASGRVRVSDFGLALLTRTEPTLTGEAARSPLLSRPGARAGTPAYMAPEQLLGSATGPATDQFSFCVTLYELLYAERPFAGTTFTEIREAVLSGVPRPAPRGTKVPGWLRLVLLKGLSASPEDRYPSMHALVSALRRERTLRRRRRVGLGLAATVGLVGLAIALGSRERATCEAGAQLRAEAWGSAQQAALRETFLSSGQPSARTAFEVVVRALDERASAWEAGFRDACEATWVRHTQSGELLDLRMACLTSRLREQRALVAVLSEGGSNLTERGPRSVHRLSSVDDCADGAALARPLALPKEHLARAEAIRSSLAQAQAQLAAARFATALTQAGQATDTAGGAGLRTLEAEGLLVKAEALLEQGALHDAARAARAAKRAAEAGRHDAARAQALIVLVDLAGRLGHLDEGFELVRDAEALVERLGDERLQGALDLRAAGVLALSGNHTSALDRFTKAAQLLTRTVGLEHPMVAAALEGQGDQHLALGRYAAARQLQAQALELREHALGAEHPDVGASLTHLGIAERKVGELTLALKHQQRALAIAQAALGPDHPATARTRASLAATWLAMGQQDDALHEYEQALALQQAQLGADHPEVLATLISLGNVLALKGDLGAAAERYRTALAGLATRLDSDPGQEALVLASLGRVRREEGRLNEAKELEDRALDLRRRTYGEEHPAVAASLTELGHLSRARGHPEEAVETYQRAIDVLERSVGDTHSDLSEPLGGLGLAHLALGDAARAAWVLERALALRPKEEPDPVTRAELRFGLAQALNVDGGNQLRAITLTLGARGDLELVPRRGATLQQAVARWLREREQG
jgi:tetratricopeptide (TPR) repeat protein